MLDLARKVLDVEAQAILAMKERLNSSFEKAVETILSCRGKLIFTGTGKSGHIARKVAATFSSTGTPSLFLHPSECLHGDMGFISTGDVVCAMTYRGDSLELQILFQTARKKNVSIILLTGNFEGELAQFADVVLNVKVSREACPLGLAPTASSTATLAMGDALAMVTHSKKSFTAEQFAANHPGGGLGFKLTRIRELMHAGPGLPILPMDAPMTKVLSVMSRGETRGAAGIVDPEGALVGVITDGDIRRRLENSQNPLEGRADTLMTRNPKTIDAEELAERALFLLEQFPINVLFVLDKSAAEPRKPIGIIHVQDLVRARLR